MPNYADCALMAAARSKAGDNPVSAWKAAAASVFPGKKFAQDKGCPKGAFLGLCEEGLIKGITRGSYTRSKDNKRYAIDAAMLLKKMPELSRDADRLWSLIPGHPLNENSQMQVVLALWTKGLIA